MGADALRGLLGQDGLSIESVDDVMQKIQDTFEDQKEIEDALMMGNEEISGIDDDEIENELSQLVQEEHISTKTPSPVPVQVQLPKKSPAASASSITADTASSVNSELSRLNQMFSSVKGVPTSITPPPSAENEGTKQKELAS